MAYPVQRVEAASPYGRLPAHFQSSYHDDPSAAHGTVVALAEMAAVTALPASRGG